MSLRKKYQEQSGNQAYISPLLGDIFEGKPSVYKNVPVSTLEKKNIKYEVRVNNKDDKNVILKLLPTIEKTDWNKTAFIIPSLKSNEFGAYDVLVHSPTGDDLYAITIIPTEKDNPIKNIPLELFENYALSEIHQLDIPIITKHKNIHFVYKNVNDLKLTDIKTNENSINSLGIVDPVLLQEKDAELFINTFTSKKSLEEYKKLIVQNENIENEKGKALIEIINKKLESPDLVEEIVESLPVQKTEYDFLPYDYHVITYTKNPNIYGFDTKMLKWLKDLPIAAGESFMRDPSGKIHKESDGTLEEYRKKVAAQKDQLKNSDFIIWTKNLEKDPTGLKLYSIYAKDFFLKNPEGEVGKDYWILQINLKTGEQYEEYKKDDVEVYDQQQRVKGPAILTYNLRDELTSRVSPFIQATLVEENLSNEQVELKKIEEEKKLQNVISKYILGDPYDLILAELNILTDESKIKFYDSIKDLNLDSRIDNFTLVEKYKKGTKEYFDDLFATILDMYSNKEDSRLYKQIRNTQQFRDVIIGPTGTVFTKYKTDEEFFHDFMRSKQFPNEYFQKISDFIKKASKLVVTAEKPFDSYTKEEIDAISKGKGVVQNKKKLFEQDLTKIEGLEILFNNSEFFTEKNTSNLQLDQLKQKRNERIQELLQKTKQEKPTLSDIEVSKIAHEAYLEEKRKEANEQNKFSPVLENAEYLGFEKPILELIKQKEELEYIRDGNYSYFINDEVNHTERAIMRRYEKLTQIPQSTEAYIEAYKKLKDEIKQLSQVVREKIKPLESAPVVFYKPEVDQTPSAISPINDISVPGDVTSPVVNPPANANQVVNNPTTPSDVINPNNPTSRIASISNDDLDAALNSVTPSGNTNTSTSGSSTRSSRAMPAQNDDLDAALNSVTPSGNTNTNTSGSSTRGSRNVQVSNDDLDDILNSVTPDPNATSTSTAGASSRNSRGSTTNIQIITPAPIQNPPVNQPQIQDLQKQIQDIRQQMRQINPNIPEIDPYEEMDEDAKEQLKKVAEQAKTGGTGPVKQSTPGGAVIPMMVPVPVQQQQNTSRNPTYNKYNHPGRRPKYSERILY